ncbi:MAG: response regulator [Planctomycetes bacterium]|nr:response regulator [Planctomycetota bacterium]
MSKQTINILLVEDDQEHVRLVQRAFRAYLGRFCLTEAASLEDARVSLSETCPDLVITDMRLPDGRGIELLAPEEGSRRFPMVVMTGFGDEQLAVEAMKAGALDYVVKSHETLVDMPHIADRALKQWRYLIERKGAKEKLLKYEQRLQSLMCQLTRVEAKERKHIAGVLHDDIIQNLVFMKMKFDDLRAFSSSHEHSETLGKIEDLADDLITKMRTLTFDLSSPVLYDLGLGPAVKEWLSRQIEQKHGISVDFEDDGRVGLLSEDLRVLLYRGVRELLTNVVKHAQTKSVKVSIRRNRDKIIVAVEDDGLGFTVPKDGFKYDMSGGFGLFTISEGLEQCNGSLQVESEPGHGTRITLTAPLQE